MNVRVKHPALYRHQRICQIMFPAVSWVHMEKQISSMPILWHIAFSLQQSHSTRQSRLTKSTSLASGNRHKYRNKSKHVNSTRDDTLTTNLAAVVCVCVCVDVCQCAQFDQFLPARSHFESKRRENLVRIAKFPYAAFGPLFAFHCPLFFTRNNDLECKS